MLHTKIADRSVPAADFDSERQQLDTQPTIAVTVGASGATGLLASAGLIGLVLLGLLVAAAVSLVEHAELSHSAAQAPPTNSSSLSRDEESLFVGAGELRRWQDDGEEVLLLDARETPQWSGAMLHVCNTSCSLPWKSLSRWEQGGADKSVLLPVSILQQRLRTCGLRRDRTQRVVVYGDWAEAWGEEGRLFWTLEYLSPTIERRVFVLRGGFAAWEAMFPEQVTPTLIRVPVGDFVVAEQLRRRLLKPQITASLARGSDGTSDVSSEAALRRLRLLDSREPEEYTGSIDPYDVARAGHVPGAVSFPWKTVFQPPAAHTANQRGDIEAGAWPDLLPCHTLRPRFLNALQLSTEVDATNDRPEVPLIVEVGTYCTGKQRHRRSRPPPMPPLRAVCCHYTIILHMVIF